MRITYRNQGVKDYWASRWADISADGAMTNEGVYPLKYALQTVLSRDGTILEAGFGGGARPTLFPRAGVRYPRD
jgi:hypothetical protein